MKYSTRHSTNLTSLTSRMVSLGTRVLVIISILLMQIPLRTVNAYQGTGVMPPVRENQFLAEITEEPLTIPTEVPTEIPTETPIEIPTEAPTDVPVEVPTETPVEVPTEVVTEIPTELPTDSPTEWPSEIPTGTPTGIVETPTETPTFDLTPTATPSLTPTILPTVDAGGKIREYFNSDGELVEEMIIDSPPHPSENISAADLETIDLSGSSSRSALTYLNVPAYRWVYGCSAVSAAMLAAFYDRSGYPNIYTGPTNGGVMPMSEDPSWSSWSDGSVTYPNNPLVASRNGLDGRTSKGSIDDYWIRYGSYSSDPFIGRWTEHTYGDSIGDYMLTSQSSYGNADGATIFINIIGKNRPCDNNAEYGEVDGSKGIKDFFESRGYSVSECYSRRTDNLENGGFSFEQFKSEINAGNPVIINFAGHTIIGIGYDNSSQTIYINTTWDNGTHSMVWGGSYDNREMRSVIVVHLPSNLPPAPALLLPVAGATSNNTSPSFSWESTSNAVQYNIQVSTSIDFDSFVIDKTLSSTSYTVESPLSSDGNYYWRVAGTNEIGAVGTFSTPRLFVLDTLPPDFPTLTAPADASTPVGIPTFTWSAPTGTNAYRFQIDEQADNFGSPFYTTPEETPLTSASHRPTGLGLVNGTVYSWRVMARDAAGNWGDWSTARTVNVQESLPSAPLLSTPANGSFINIQPVLSWNSVSTASIYQVQIDNVSTFTEPIFENKASTGDLTYTVITPLTEATWYWRVRATNGTGGTGNWSSVWSFTYDIVPPAAPVLSSPVNDFRTYTTPAFKWSSTSTARVYKFEYGTTTNGTIATFSPVYTSSELTTTTHTPPAIALGGFYWHVQARDVAGNWSDWSELRKINMMAPILAAPVLVSPIPDSLTNNPLVTFTWNAVTNAKSYKLQYADTSTFSLSDPDTTTVTNLYDITTYSIADPGELHDGKWYWRVLAVNSDDVDGRYSSPRIFTLDTVPPAVPALSAPDNGSTPIGIPSFKWSAPTGSKKFLFEIADNSGFNPSLYSTPESTPLTSATYKPANLVPGTVYYWHVKGSDAAGNWTVWSAAYTVNVQLAMPGTPVLTGPVSGFVSNNRTPTFTWKASTNNTNTHDYELQIDTVSSFATPDITLSNILETSITLPVDKQLSAEGKYYWRVRAQNATHGYSAWSSARTYFLDTTAPGVPVLSSPVNGATPVGIPTFKWSVPTGANAFIFEIADNPNFSSPLYTTPEGTPLCSASYKPENLEVGTGYSWHVKARDAAGNWGGWSEASTVNVQLSLPGAPVLLAPLTGLISNNSTPSFSWNAVTDADYYQLQISDVSSFAGPIVDIPNLTALTYDLPEGNKLPSDKTWYWRVRAQNGTGGYGKWSSAFTYKLDTEPPGAPVLTFPANGATPVGIPTLKWSVPTGAKYYLLEIDDDMEYGSPLYPTPESTPLTSASYKPAGLEVGTVYYWHVKARDLAGNWGDWSDDFTVNVQTSLPGTPVLISPVSGLVSNVTAPTFTWKAAAGAKDYQLQISTVSTFATPNVTVSDIEGLTHTLGGDDILSAEGTYYWRVRAQNNDDGFGSWSSARTYKLDTTPPVAPTLKSPADGDNTLRIIPTFKWSTSTDSKAYQLLIDNDADFSSPILATPDGSPERPDTPVSISSFTPDSLPLLTLLYWCVKSRDFAGNWGACSTSRTLTLQPPIPAAPTLISPLNNSTLFTYTPTFQWKSVTDSTEYELLVDDSNLFTSVDYSTSLIGNSNTQQTIDKTLNENTKYYWKVRSKNVLKESNGWSTIWSFNTGLKSPIIVEPVEGGTVDSLLPTFKWEAVTTATGYVIQISKVIDFKTIEKTFTLTSAATDYTPTTGLPAGMTLYWRIKATGTYPGDWSTIGIFNTPTPPSIPNIFSPLNTNISVYKPELTWQASSASTAYYQFQLSISSSFSSGLIEGKTPGLHYQLSEELLDATKYYWHIRSVDNEGHYSNWSTTAFFTTPGKITGQVLDAVTNSGVGNVLIQVKGKNLSGTTDKDGNYVIKGITAGSYQLLPAAEGYKFSPGSISISYAASNKTATKIIANKLLKVSGQVILDPRVTIQDLSSSNSTISASEVSSTGGVANVTVKDNQGHSVITDANGEYSINNASSGAYTLNLVKSGHTAIPISRNFTLQSNAPSQYFMITPRIQPNSKLIYPSTSGGVASFSANGRFVVISAAFNTDGKVIDLYTGVQISGIGLHADISGDGRFVTYGKWLNDEVTVYVLDRDIDNNGIFDEPGKTEEWSLTNGLDETVYNEVDRGADIPKISEDGRYIIFKGSPNEGDGDHGDPGSCGKILIHEVNTRTTICPEQIALVDSVDDISINGRFILFSSWSNLLPEDKNYHSCDDYVFDRDTDNNGIFDEEGKTNIELLSISDDGYSPDWKGYYHGGSISADGRYAVFTSWGLDPRITSGGSRVFLRDRQNKTTRGITGKFTIAGCDSVELENSHRERITPDGRYILFNSTVQCGYNNNTAFKLTGGTFLYDRDTDQDGIFDETNSTKFELVNLFYRDNTSTISDFSADGRFILFNGYEGVYLLDRGTNINYSITGRVVNGEDQPIPGISIVTSDSHMAVTNQDGYYSFTGLTGGTYYLSPSDDQVTFSPTQRVVVVPPISSGQDFKVLSGYTPKSSLKGRLVDVYNAPIEGVLLDDGNGHQTTTDSQGYYSFTDLENGLYTLTPSKDGYAIFPSSVEMTVSGEDIAGINFTAQRVFNLSGKVTTNEGVGIEGVTIEDEYGDRVVTDADGNFIFPGIPSGGYTITASKSGYTFNPDWQYVEIVASDVSSINFYGGE